MNVADALPGNKGAYIVWLKPEKLTQIEVGKLGTMALQPGYYAYVGSAMGPGGVRARLQHHLRIAARPRWHIDYLRAACQVCRLWYVVTDAKVERQWAAALASLPGATVALSGFGASDHPGATHLFHFQAVPSLAAFVGQWQQNSGIENKYAEIFERLVPLVSPLEGR